MAHDQTSIPVPHLGCLGVVFGLGGVRGQAHSGGQSDNAASDAPRNDGQALLDPAGQQ